MLTYLKPEEVYINEPPTKVNNIKNNDKSSYDVWIKIPEVEIDEVIARKILTKSFCGIKKK